MKPLRNIMTIVTVAVVAVATLASAPGAVASARDATAALPTRAELRSARINLSDLPGDFRRDYSDDSSSSSTSRSTDPECTKKLEDLNSNDRDSTAAGKAAIAFRLDKATGPFVGNSVGVWRTKTPAVEGIAGIRSLLRTCDRWTETDVDGTKATVRLTRLPMPALGDERIAFRAKVTLREGGFAITARVDFAVVRVRTAVTFVSLISFGAPDGINLVDLTRLSTTRLKAVV